MTHAFFKACLFLGAGSVMHAMHGELDIFKMGGLKRKMPHTHWTFFIATLAIAGIPGLSGFFSKDEILWMAFSAPRGHAVLYFIGLATAAMTAFYMFRAVILTFWGEPRDHHLYDHAHESPPVMTVVLWTLAVLAIVGGWIGLPKALTGGVIPNVFEHWLEPVFAQGEAVIEAHAHAVEHSHSLELGMMVVSVAAAALGILIALSVYGRGLAKAEGFRAKAPAVHRVMFNKYFVDEGIFAVIVRPLHRFSESFLWRFFDVIVIDGSVNGVAKTALFSAGVLRKLQSGYVFSYALGIVIGCVAILGALVWYLAQATGF
jgi:NADH-quinone oxidoreductase subunit L